MRQPTHVTNIYYIFTVSIIVVLMGVDLASRSWNNGSCGCSDVIYCIACQCSLEEAFI